MTTESYVPEVGASVTARMLPGVFEVIAVDTERMTANLRLLGPEEHIEKDVPFGVILPFQQS